MRIVHCTKLPTLHLQRPQEKYTEAIPLLERALSIHMKKLGGSHPDTLSSQNNLEIVRQKVRAQLSGRVGKRSIYPTARSPGTIEISSFRMTGVKTRSKQLRGKSVTANPMNNARARPMGKLREV